MAGDGDARVASPVLVEEARRFVRSVAAELRPRGPLVTPFYMISIPVMVLGAVLIVIRFTRGLGAGANPAVFALTVAIATSNSFIIPTHQVNALIMGPGGYRVADFIRAGSPMSLLLIVVMLIMVNVVFRV